MVCRVRWLIAVLVAVLTVAAIPGIASASPAVAVKIAVAGPLGTVGAVQYGLAMKRGVDLAVDDFATQLESSGVTLTIVPFDDMGSPQVAVGNAQAIVAQSDILGVVGHINSGCSIPAADVYSDHQLAMVTPNSTNPRLTQLGLNNVFRTCATDSGQGPFAAQTALRNLRASSAYIVDDSTTYGTLLSSGFSKKFKSGKGTVMGWTHTSDRQVKFTSLVKKIKAKKPSIVYYGGIYNAGALLARQLKAKGVKATFIGADGIHDPMFVSLEGKGAAAGSLATEVGRPVDQLPGGVDFTARYANKYPGIAPMMVDAYAYDAAATEIRAILAVVGDSGPSALQGATVREQIRVKIAASNFVGVTGPVAFNSAGDTKNVTFSAYRVQAGKWKECAQVSIPSVPTGIHPLMPIWVSGFISPAQPTGTKPVAVRFYRRVGGRWVLGKTAAASVFSGGGVNEYDVRVTLSRKGYWRVIASNSDATHAALDSPARYFWVK